MIAMMIMRLAVTGMVLAGMAAWAGADEKKTPKPAKAEDVVKALTYKDGSDLARAMTDVTDKTPHWREAAFYLLLQRAATLAPLGADELIHLDRPAYRSLIAEPSRYRCRAVRMTVRVHTVKKMTGRELVAGGRVWPTDRPVWRLRCSDANVSAETGPIVICSTVEPTGLGKPSDKTKKDKEDYEPDELLYAEPREIELALVFYKVYKGNRQDTGAERDYPVAIAWYMPTAGDGATGLGALDIRYVAGAVGIIGLCLAYYFIRKRVKRMGKPGTRIEYKPKRDEPVDEPVGEAEDDEAEDDGAEAEAVDPLLAAAAEEYEKERQARDAEDHG